MKILPFLNKYFLTPHIWINSVPSLLPLFPISEAPSIGSLIHVVRNFRVFFSMFFPFSIFPVCLFVLRWSVVSNSATSWTVARQVRLSVLFSRQDYWSGLLFPISGIFTTQIWDPCLLSLLNCRWILHPLSHPGSPFDVFFLYSSYFISNLFSSLLFTGPSVQIHQILMDIVSRIWQGVRIYVMTIHTTLYHFYFLHTI